MALIDKIRVAGTGQRVPLDIVPCSLDDVRRWQKYVHNPFIRPLGGIGSDWNWPSLYKACNTIETFMGRQATTLQFRVEGPGGNAVPVAQCMFSMPYAYPGLPPGTCLFLIHSP